MKNLAYCVSLVQLDRDDFSPQGRSKYLQYAINTYKEHIAFGLGQSVEVMYATPDALGMVDFPCDYEYYTKVAINVGGNYLTLTLNRNMALNRKWNCGEETHESRQATDGLDALGLTASAPYGVAFAGHYRAGNFVGELYGLGGGINAAGYFTEDRKLRRFQFTNLPTAREVVIEYVSNSISEGSIVEDMAINVIRYGVHDQLALFSGDNQAEKQRFEGRFREALREYQIKSTMPTLSDYLDAMYRDLQSSPKR